MFAAVEFIVLEIADRSILTKAPNFTGPILIELQYLKVRKSMFKSEIGESFAIESGNTRTGAKPHISLIVLKYVISRITRQTFLHGVAPEWQPCGHGRQAQHENGEAYQDALRVQEVKKHFAKLTEHVKV